MDLEKVVESLLLEVPLIDGHNDFLHILRGWFRGQYNTIAHDINQMPVGQTDLFKLKQSGLGGQFWSIFVSCPKKTDKIEVESDDEELQVLRQAMQQIDLFHQLCLKFPERFRLAENSKQAITIFRSGGIAGFLGLEGLHQIGNSASVLRLFHRLGVRYITLCHSESNQYADSATAAVSLHDGGLSKNGVDIILEMNRQGIIVDLSHTSEPCQLKTLELSKAPVIFSHSSCYALTPNVRNTSDKVLKELKKNGGVIMICFLPSLVRKTKEDNATVMDVVEHIIYAAELIGYEHVGIGSDFDGMLNGPEDLDSVLDYRNIIRGLLMRGVCEEYIKMIMGLNLFRVLDAVQDFSASQTVRGKGSLCDTIPDLWTPEQRQMLLSAGSKRRSALK